MKNGILVVSFGTSFNNSRDITIGAIENEIADAFPQYPVRRAFTSQIIIDKLAERDGLEIDNVTQALDRAVADGIRTLIVQPTHMMSGYEYTDLSNELAEYESDFEKIVLGEPLLTTEEDFQAVATQNYFRRDKKPKSLPWGKGFRERVSHPTALPAGTEDEREPFPSRHTFQIRYKNLQK